MEKMENSSSVLGYLARFEDPRMDRFMMTSPLQPLAVIGLYLLFIYKIGPRLMEKREAFDLRAVIIVYNLSQILANIAVFFMFAKSLPHLNILCTPPAEKMTTTPAVAIGMQAHYYYTLLKYYDFTETIFFVLRKKRRQISYLHVHHHVGMLVAAWLSCRYFPGGQALFVGLYNSFIHTIMYCYYLLTSLDTNYTKNAWWKKYITLIQIVQHYMVFLSTFPSVVNLNCSYPKWLMGLFDINVILIIYLFSQFYRENYVKKNKKQ